MPRLTLTPAEGLLLAMLDDEAETLRQRARDLVGEADEKRALGLRLVFESHKERAPDLGGVSLQRDDKGKPVSIGWTKAGEE